MTLCPARFLRLRRLSCRVLGCSPSAVRRRWYEQRFPDHTIWHSLSTDNALIACMVCGREGDGFRVDPGAELVDDYYPTWIPPHLRPERLNRTCPLCLLRGRSMLSMRCECCGVTDEELDRAGIR